MLQTVAFRRALAVVVALVTLTLAAPAHADPQDPDRASAGSKRPVTVALADSDATKDTRALFAYLDKLQGSGVLFGHQHDLSHGFTFDTPDGTSSDTKAAVNDYPALFGWDTLILEGKEKPGVTGATDAANVRALSWAIQRADALGGVNTLSSHMPNFVTGGTFNDTEGNVVRHILPGGDKHAAYDAFLDRIAAAAKGSTRTNGSLIPIIYRPFHENNGGWFWWGAGHTTSAEYIEIYRYTVEYLRDVKKVHNLLFAYSPNGSLGGNPDTYLKTYPGDAFVDILGYDNYDGSTTPEDSATWRAGVLKDLTMIVNLAAERHKVPAFTEFGQAGPEGSIPTWFTDLLNAIKADPIAKRVTYMETWANFGGTSRAYVPYPAYDGHAAHVMLPDFQRFHADPYSLFASNLSGVFDTKTKAEKAPVIMHLVTPTDRQRITTPSTTVRVRVTGGIASSAKFTVNDGEPQKLRRDAEGFYSATWNIDPSWLDNRAVTVSVSVVVKGKTYTDDALAILGAVAPLPAGWVDNYDGYAGDNVTLSEAYSHVNANTTTLTTEHKRSGTYGLAYFYDFTDAGYTGIGKSVSEDWSTFSALKLWLQGDGSGNGATLQIVADGTYFESSIDLSNSAGADIAAPFTQFKPAPWDTAHAGAVLDAAHLTKVTQFNLYLGHGSGAATTGTVYVDDIRAE